MTSTKLKIIACISMLIDHIGLLLLNNNLIFRFIGRLAFPIFAFLVAEGFYHTRDKQKYLMRMFTFAFISEIPFDYALTGELFNFLSFNIFFTLSLSLIAIYSFYKNKYFGFVMLVIVGLVAQYIRVDYGAFGVLIIFGFYFFRGSLLKQSLSFIFITLVMVTRYWILHPTWTVHPSNHWAILKQAMSVFALPFLVSYNHKRGKNIKYFFYGFYPIHLLLLGFIKHMLL